MSGELQRINADGIGEKLVDPIVKVVASALDTAASLDRVKEVMRLIAAEADSGTWSTDEEWLRKLPAWFTKPFQSRTIEDVLKDDALWDFGSWLDAMRQRGWQWWSSTHNGNQWSAILLRQEEIYSIEPFVYLARQCGATYTEVTEQ